MALILSPRQLSQRGELYHQLGQLTAAGLGVMKAVDLLGRNPPAHSYRKPLQELGRHLSQGETFTGAVERLGRWAPAFDISLIQAGEHSGRLDAVFKMLGTYYTDRAKLLRQALSDLAYPVFVFHVAVFVFPFINYFKNSDLTAFLLGTLGVLIPVYVAVFLLIYAGQARRAGAWRSALETFLRPFPLLGSTRQCFSLARLAAALEALLNAGVTVIEAWDLAAAASGSPALQREVAAWRPAVVAGLTPSEAVSASRRFPELFANLYHSGEISGKLDDSLHRLYEHYQDEGMHKLRALTKWVPQILYLGVAVMVGYKVISFYTGYFDMINKAGGF